MTEQTEVTTPDVVPEQEINFQGRKLRVKMPRPEQILVWKRTLAQLESMGGSDWTADNVMATLERLRKIIDSILADKTDVTWLDDQFLDGSLNFQTTMPIFAATVDAFADAAEREGNRATRRATKKTVPAKKATRKAAS